MRNLLFYIVAVPFLLLGSFFCQEDDPGDCPTCPPPPHVAKIAFSVDQVETGDAWFRVWTTDSSALGKILVNANDKIVSYFDTGAQDTVAVSGSLLPMTTYNFSAYRLSPSYEKTDSTAPVTVTTMDTTSSNFTWEKLIFGVRINGYLNDVAIINDTCIYAVGEIPVRDSTGQIDDINSPNVVKWNGKEWTLQRIYYSNCEAPSSPYRHVPELNYILAFGENDIWFGVGTILFHWNGQSYEQQCVPEELILGFGRGGGIVKLWGTSSNDFYAVGSYGLILHYNGREWERIESGTTLSITDIWGDRNPKTGEMEILAIASPPNGRTESQLLQIKGKTAIKLPDRSLENLMSHVWFAAGKLYYVAGGEVQRKHHLMREDAPWLPDYGVMNARYINAIRGNALNDIVTVGQHGELLHFNGKRWARHIVSTVLNEGEYYGVAIKGDLIVAVGILNFQAVVLVGRR